ncbi:PIG-L deacetylase family protein [Hydrogenophaga sp.]|uniref:PIG-L deacetylase family protein n=1 Tax=Hydrogenophaga sp. TaxID=1904254 RepID=UPI002726D6CD|nr:PIG-L family deacetylase [Hydrogenophaga sp.]MDO8906265.1 PIG-L family deacetylase [Hydrogenophaga sp.]
MPPLLQALQRRVEHAIRRHTARRMLVALKRATHRLPSTLHVPVRSRVLVIAPHTDDEVIPCGGTLLQHRQLGSQTRVVFATDSTAGLADADLARRLQRLRRDESEQVANAMQFESVVRLDLPDGRLVRYETTLEKQLVDQILSFQPDIIYCPFPGDGHADHQACALAVGDAAVQLDWKGRMHAYEVWTALWPNIMIDISEQAAEKEDLIRMYASQMADRDYAAGVLGLNRYRGLQHRVRYAEAFYACDAREFQALTNLLNQLAPSSHTAGEHTPQVNAPLSGRSEQAGRKARSAAPAGNTPHP